MLHKIINTIIILNLFVFAWGMIDHEHHHIVETLHLAFLTIFLVEVAYRWWKGRKGGWLYFDTTVIVLSLLPIIGADAALLRVTNAARVIHTLRHAEHLRIFDLVRLARFARVMAVAAVALVVAFAIYRASFSEAVQVARATARG